MIGSLIKGDEYYITFSNKYEQIHKYLVIGIMNA